MSLEQIATKMRLPPIPPVEANLTWFDAGAVRIAVEYRQVNEAIADQAYRDDETHRATLESLRNQRDPKAPPPDEEGISFHVFESDPFVERLRFDCFAKSGHYHYLPDGGKEFNYVVFYDADANGDMADWVTRTLRSRLGSMLIRAGAATAAEQLDDDAVARTIDEVTRYVATIRGNVAPPSIAVAS